ncbi:MAG: YihY/virulence factor BrkB family protein, partial [Bryobacteraceae bacterium]
MSTGPPKLYLTQAGHWGRLWPPLRFAVQKISRDGCLGIAKGAAYSAMLAFFPVLTALAAILVQAKAEAVSRTVAHLLYDVVPPGTEDVVRMLFVVHGQRPAWLLVAAATLAVWAASGAMMSLMEGFRAIYKIPAARPWLRERVMATLLVFTSALPVIAASAFIVFGKRSETALIGWWGLTAGSRGWVQLAGQVVRFTTATGSIVIANALIYYWGPNRRQIFQRVFPGAILATVLWLLATLGFGLYVRHVSNYNVLYGSVG